MNALAGISFDRYVPSPREAVTKLEALRIAHGSGVAPRTEPFLARSIHSLPSVNEAPTITTFDDVDRAWQILHALPEVHGFEALEMWPETRFDRFQLRLPQESQGAEGSQLLYLSPGSFYSGAEECLWVWPGC